MNRLREFISGIKNGFKNFGTVISSIVNSILLTAVYILGVGITSIIAKISKKKFLQLKEPKDAKTYWTDLSLGKKPIEEYYHQF
jgi:hypothetical protein